jgi:hypothetical protein
MRDLIDLEAVRDVRRKRLSYKWCLGQLRLLFEVADYLSRRRLVLIGHCLPMIQSLESCQFVLRPANEMQDKLSHFVMLL